MSVVTEYFVAKEAELATTFAGWRWSSASLPPPSTPPSPPPVATPDLSRFARVILRGVSPTELVTLQGAFGDGAAHEEEIRRPLILAPPVPGRTQWVHRLPAELVARLAPLTEGEVDAVGERWANAELACIETIEDEGVRFSRRAHHRVRFWQDMLSEMVTLASLAHAQGDGLFLYMHL
jgi:hypothetical protein